MAARGIGVLIGLSSVLALAFPAAAFEGLGLKVGFFTDRVEEKRDPGKPLTVYRRAGGVTHRVWFFSSIRCNEVCLRALQDRGSFDLAHYWYLQVGDQWIELDKVPASLTQTPREDTGWRFPSNKENLQRGTYLVIVRGEDDDLCLETGACEFRVDIE